MSRESLARLKSRLPCLNHPRRLEGNLMDRHKSTPAPMGCHGPILVRYADGVKALVQQCWTKDGPNIPKDRFDYCNPTTTRFVRQGEMPVQWSRVPASPEVFEPRIAKRRITRRLAKHKIRGTPLALKHPSTISSQRQHSSPYHST